MNLIVSAVLVASLLGGAVLGAQSQQTPRAVFKSGIDLVRLDVRVTGADGRPIKDLRADEIEVIEEGEIRPLLLFQHVDEPAGSYAEVSARTRAADVSTNQGALRGHLYVLVFDQHHITPGNAQRARAAAQTFLKTRLRPGDRVAVYGIPGPGPSVNFTADGARAAAELKKVSGTGEQFGRGSLGTMRLQEAYEIARGNDDVLTRVFMRASQQGAATDVLDVLPGIEAIGGLGAASGDPAVMRQLIRQDADTIVARADESARRFLLILADVVRSLRDIEGRKALLLFSEGFYTDNVSRELEHVAAAAAQSYSVIYGFDLNRRGLNLTEEGARGGEQYSEIADRLNPLGSLAAETSGELIIDASSRVEPAIARMATLSQDYYIVGFQAHPAATSERAKYRRVRVTVKRPGARVSTRTGYVVNNDPTPADRRRAIDIALAAPFPVQGLQVEYTTYVLGGTAPGQQRVVMSLEAQLPVASENASTADVVFVVRSLRDGRSAASGTDTMPLPRQSGAEDTMGKGSYRVQFELPSGEYLMRVIVREPAGLVGSADRRFVVRALDGPAFTTGELILQSAHTAPFPVRAAVYASEMLTGMTEIYARAPGQLQDLRGTVSLIPVGGGAAVRSTGLEIAGREPSPATTAVARFELPLQDLEAGAYVAQVAVRRGDETVAELTREVRVLPGSAPGSSTSRVPAPAPAGETDRPSVKELLEGQTVAAYLSRIGPVVPAAKHAIAGAWEKVDAALEPRDGVLPAPALALRGLTRFAQADYPAAAQALQAAFDKEPQDAALAFFLGWAAVGAGDDRKAISSWRAALVIDPTLLPAYLALIDTYLRIDQPALAGQVVVAGLNALPRSPELLARREQLIRR